MSGFYGNRNIIAAWYGTKRLDKIMNGTKVIFDFDELKPKYYYYYGDGSSNTKTRHTGGDYGTALYYVKGDPLTTGNTPTIVQMPYSGFGWSHYTEGNVGGDPSASFTASQYVYTWSYYGSGGSGTSTSTWNVSDRTDADHEYTISYSAYTDEGRETIGPIKLTFDGTQMSIQEAINNGCIKPLVPISLYSEASGTTFNVSNLINGSSTIASQDDWAYSIGFAIQTNKGHHLESIYVGSWKEGLTIRVWDSIYGRITINNRVYRKSQYTDPATGKKRKYW